MAAAAVMRMCVMAGVPSRIMLCAVVALLLPFIIGPAHAENEKPPWMEARWSARAKAALDYHDRDRFAAAIDTFDEALAYMSQKSNRAKFYTGKKEPESNRRVSRKFEHKVITF